MHGENLKLNNGWGKCLNKVALIAVSVTGILMLEGRWFFEHQINK